MTARTLFVRGSLALALLAAPAWCFAARPTVKTDSSSYRPEAEPVDLFDAIDDGLVEVKFIPKNEKQARVRIKNRSGQPLSVRLPEAFGARAVLAQAGGPFGAAGNNGSNAGAQNLGSTFGGPNNQNGGIFNVPADKPAELRVACVCLEYGKPTPRPAIPYEMVRLDAVSKDPSLARLLPRLETSNQHEVQAAAWHLAGGMSWHRLASVHVEHLVELNEPFFSMRDLKQAKELVREVTANADESGSSPGAATSAATKGERSKPGSAARLAVH